MVSSPLFDAISPEMRLLLGCCRLEQDPVAVEALRRAACEVVDWPGLVHLARECFLVPMAHRHLSGHCRDLVPAPVLEQLLRMRHRVTRNSLLIAATLHDLVGHFLQPLGVPYFAFKGAALAQSCYGSLEQRFSRDIDIFIAPVWLGRVVDALTAAGYRLKDEEIIPDDAARQAYFAMISTLSVVSPAGIIIEVHTRLDFLAEADSGYLEKILPRLETIDIAGAAVVVPCLADHFVLICSHHFGHYWSKLHWLADLAVLSDHPTFDEGAVRRRAREMGLSRIVDASLFLRDVLLRGAPWQESAGGLQTEMVLLCLRHLDPGGRVVAHGRTGGRRALWAEKVGNVNLTYWRGFDDWRVGPRMVCRRLFSMNYFDWLYLRLPRHGRILYPVVRVVRLCEEFLRGREAWLRGRCGLGGRAGP